METVEADLKEHEFLKGLDAGYSKTLLECASPVQFHADQFIFREGEAANWFYLITHGKVAIELHGPDRGSMIIETVEAGDVIGWSWLFSPYKWHFDARAIVLTRAIALDGRSLRERCDRDPAFGYELMKRFTNVVVDRLEAARIRLLDLYGVRAKG
ncbi:MAG: cyclic nucleotide-binding domain-containing protein [Candidatus Omnitrophica bacterium]|nr:cyclic nucleotide-binding domain-containing protein [Candidatus Omnitrophota bacterium]